MAQRSLISCPTRWRERPASCPSCLAKQLRATPNQLTLLRLIFIPFIAMMVVDGRFAWALALFVVAGISDGMDGYLARRLNQRTTLGENFGRGKTLTRLAALATLSRTAGEGGPSLQGLVGEGGSGFVK